MIAIKTMTEMPNNCYECYCIYTSPFRVDALCNASQMKKITEYGRPEWCPLVEVKEDKDE